MGRIFSVLFGLCYLVVTINGFVSPQAYWNSKLPHTPIPQHIKDSLVTPGGDHVVQPSIARKFLGSTKDQFDLKSIIESYIGTHGYRRSLSSSSDSDSSYRQKHAKESSLKELLVSPNPLFFYSEDKLPEDKTTTNLKEHSVSPNPLFFYSSDRLNEGEKEYIVSPNPLFFYSGDKLPKDKTTNLKEHSVSPNPLFFYSSDRLNEGEKSVKREYIVSPNPLFFYSSDKLPEGKEYTVSPNPLFFYSSDKLHEGEDASLKEQLVSPNPLFFYSSKKLPKGKTTNLKEHLVSPNPLFFYSSDKLNEGEESSLKEHLASPNPLFFYSSDKLPKGKTTNLKENSVSPNPLFFYSSVKLHEGEESSLGEHLVSPNPLFFYSSDKLPEGKTTNLEEHSVSPNPLFFYSSNKLQSGEDSSLKEQLVSPNPLFFYSSHKLHEGEDSSLKEQLVSPNPLFFYSSDKLSDGKMVNLKGHSVSPNPLFFYSNKQLDSKISMHKDVAHNEEGHLIFVEEDLHIGKTLKLHFKKGSKNNPFLPRDVSNKIPFSSKDLLDTLNLLSINPESNEAESISEKMSLCEEPAIEGLQKQCVTSLESMLDFVVSSLGTNVEPLIIEVEKDLPKMEYKIESVERLTKNDHETVVCHKMEYPYALYFCHGTLTLRPYMVSLVGEDGTKIRAVASCHKETSDVMKTYMKDVLKVMPGTTRICHIPPAEDNIFWINKSV